MPKEHRQTTNKRYDLTSLIKNFLPDRFLRFLLMAKWAKPCSLLSA